MIKNYITDDDGTTLIRMGMEILKFYLETNEVPLDNTIFEEDSLWNVSAEMIGNVLDALGIDEIPILDKCENL